MDSDISYATHKTNNAPYEASNHVTSCIYYKTPLELHEDSPKHIMNQSIN